MKKVLRCRRTGTEVEMNCMTKKVRQLEMNHYEDVWPSTQYRRFSITKLTSRYFPLTIPFQELTLQMNLDFIVVEDSEATTTGGLIFTYPIYLQCNTTTVKSIFLCLNLLIENLTSNPRYYQNIYLLFLKVSVLVGSWVVDSNIPTSTIWNLRFLSVCCFWNKKSNISLYISALNRASGW